MKNGISKDLLDDFRLMSQYCAASYWPGNNNSTDTPIQCPGAGCKYIPEGNCPLVEAANATTTVEFKDTPKFDNHGEVIVTLKANIISNTNY